MLEFLLSQDTSWAVRHDLAFPLLETGAEVASQLMMIQAGTVVAILVGAMLVAPLASLLGGDGARSVRGLGQMLLLLALAVAVPVLSALVACLVVAGSGGSWVDPPVGGAMACTAFGAVVPLGLAEKQSQINSKASRLELASLLAYPCLALGLFVVALRDPYLFTSAPAVALYGWLGEAAEVYPLWLAALVLGGAQVALGLSLTASALQGFGVAVAMLLSPRED